MKKNKVIKSVSFNPVVNEEDKIILDAIKRRNFSGYVKKLIKADVMGEDAKKRQVGAEKKGDRLNPAQRLESLKNKKH